LISGIRSICSTVGGHLYQNFDYTGTGAIRYHLFPIVGGCHCYIPDDDDELLLSLLGKFVVDSL